MIMTTQTIIGSLTMLQQRVPSAKSTLCEAITHIQSGEHLLAIGCVDSLMQHNLPHSASECVSLVRSAIVAQWGE